MDLLLSKYTSFKIQYFTPKLHITLFRLFTYRPVYEYAYILWNKSLFLEKIPGNFCIKFQCQENMCHYVQPTPLYMYSNTTSKLFTLPSFLRLHRQAAVCTVVVYSLLSWCLQSLLVYLSPFSTVLCHISTVMVTMDFVNVIHRKCDFSLFPQNND